MSTPHSKSVVSVSEMATMVELSRARFYQLVGTAFPWPLYDVTTRRPFFNEEMQELCLEVRRSNCGINGRPILFYARPAGSTRSRARAKSGSERCKTATKYPELIDGLKGLGLGSVTDKQVGRALMNEYPIGTNGLPTSDVLRTIFLAIRRRNSAGDVV